MGGFPFSKTTMWESLRAKGKLKWHVARERLNGGGRRASGLRGNPRTMKATRSIVPRSKGDRRSRTG